MKRFWNEKVIEVMGTPPAPTDGIATRDAARTTSSAPSLDRTGCGAGEGGGMGVFGVSGVGGGTCTMRGLTLTVAPNRHRARESWGLGVWIACRSQRNINTSPTNVPPLPCARARPLSHWAGDGGQARGAEPTRKQRDLIGIKVSKKSVGAQSGLTLPGAGSCGATPRSKAPADRCRPPRWRPPPSRRRESTPWPP